MKANEDGNQSSRNLKTLLVIGAGPGGLSAAIEARRQGVDQVILADREKEPGGILNQCVHQGFGVFHYGESLTGPEYAQRLVETAAAAGVTFLRETFVASLTRDQTGVFRAELFSKEQGYWTLTPDAALLAMGCRERTRAAVGVPGSRPSGVFSAGTAQRLINVEGYKLGKKAVIVGSGDIGLIMARRLTLEGVEVAAVIELMKTPSGLPRNVSQCLKAFDIPLLLEHRVTAIEGASRVTSVVVTSLATNKVQRIDCDLVLFSVGLIPENELSAMVGVTLVGNTNGLRLNESMETTVPGIFACGNAFHVYDLVDDVSREAAKAGRSAAAYLGYASEKVTAWRPWQHDFPREASLWTKPSVNSESVPEIPETNNGGADQVPDGSVLCILCPKGCQITLTQKGIVLGAGCRKGAEFAVQELSRPMAVLTSTVAIEGALWPRLPCKTDQALPRDQLKAAAALLQSIKVSAPVRIGDCLCRDLGGLGVSVVATRSMESVR